MHKGKIPVYIYNELFRTIIHTSHAGIKLYVYLFFAKQQAYICKYSMAPYFTWGLFDAKKYLNCSINFYASYSGCNLGFLLKKISANEMLSAGILQELNFYQLKQYGITD